MALLDFPSGPGTGDTYTLNGNMWKWNGTSWVAFNSLSLSSQVTGILAVQYGGTGFGGTYTKGDILYATSSNAFSKLAAGSAGSILAIDVNKDLYWKVDDAGTGSVGEGTAWGFAYYNNSTNTITSGAGFSYIAGPPINVVLKDGLLSLIGSTINSGTWAGSAISLVYGGTNNNLSGVGQSYQIAFYNATGTAITALASGAGIANSILFQTNNSSSPTWVGQSTLVVGGATTSANIQAGNAYQILYQTGANTTGFVPLATGSGASVLTQTSGSAPAYLPQSTLVVGGATTSANIQGGNAYQIHYQTGANTTGFVPLATGSGASVLTQTSGSAPAYLAQSQLVVGGATTSANIQAGNAYQLLYQTGANTTGFVPLATGSGASVLTQTSGSAPAYLPQSTLVVGGATTSANIQAGNAYQILYQTGANTTGFVPLATGSGASVLTQTNGSTPAYLPQSTLVVGGATTSANIQGGNAYQIHYQTGANTTGFVPLATGSGASVLTQTTGSAPAYLAQSQLVVGGATTSANIQAGNAYQILYQTGANTTGFVPLATGSGASVLTQTSGSAPAYLAQSQLVVGGATTSANIQGGNTGQIPYQSNSNTTTFLANSGVAGSVLVTLGSNGIGWTNAGSLAVTSLSAGANIAVSASTGSVIISNIGATSVVANSSSITITSSGTGGTGRILVDTAQNITTTGTPSFETVSVRAGTLTTTSFNNATDIVNKQYVDNLASGLDIHGSVRAIAVSGLGASYVQSSIGGSSDAINAYLISTAFGTLPNIDTTVAFGSTGPTQRILVAGGIDGKVNIGGTGYQASTGISYLANGIYYVSDLGSVSTNWKLIRATDTDANTELTAGTFTFVEEGTSYADTGWVCTNDTTNLGPIGFGITQINFSQFTGAAAFNVGQGLTKTGNTIASKVNITSTGIASGTGFTQFNIGGASVGGVADTGYYPTFSVRTSGTVAGTAILTLNETGFSMTGGTNTPKTLTITGDISLPSPTQYGIAYGSSSTAVAFLAAGGSGASVLTQTLNNNPVYLAQSQLVVGGATTSANIQAGNAYQLLYQTGANTTGFVPLATGSGASVLTQTSGSAPAYLPQSTLVVGGATTSANIQAGNAYQILYQTGANTTGFVPLATGSGASVLTQTSGSAPAYLAQSTLVVGGATTSANIQGGNAYQIHYQTGANTTGFVPLATGSGASVLTQTNGSAPAYLAQSQLVVGGATTSANIQAGNAYQLLYQTGANTTGFVPLATGSGASVLTQTSGSAPAYLAQSQLVVGGATTSANIQGGNAYQIHYQTGANTTGFVPLATGSGASVLTQTTGSAPAYLAQSQLSVGSATTATRVGITTSSDSGNLPIVFADAHQPSAALGSSTLLTYQPSSGKITNGIWAGTAVTTKYGGTGFDTVSANQVLMGAASGNTWAAIASTNLPVAAISATPPTKPGGAIGDTQAGQLWWDSEYGVLKIYYTDASAPPTSQWVDATPVLGSSGGGSSTKRSYVMTFGAGFTPSTGADTVQILIPYAPDNTSKYYFIKRLDYRANTAGTGVSFYIERFTGGNAAFDVSSGNRIHSASGASFVAASGLWITSYTQSSSGASFVSSSGIAGSILSGDYLRLNFSHINSAANMSVSMIIEEQ